jgi:hypothetical protein
VGSRLVSVRKHWTAILGALALITGVGLGVFAVSGMTRNESKPPVPGPSGLVTSVSLSPKVLLFGDELKARFVIVVDPDKVNPNVVQLETFFEPFDQVSRTVTRRDEPNATELVYTITLECNRLRCLPAMTRKREFTFPNARLTYREAGQVSSFPNTFSLGVPPVGIASRLNTEEVTAARQASPVRAVEGSASGLVAEDAALLVRDSAARLPAASYRIDPALLAAILLVLTAALAAAAGVLVVRQIGSDDRPAVVEKVAVVPATPLDHALGQLDLALSNGRVDQQRKALELLARELRHSGEDGLAQEARHLAWGEEAVARDDARALAQTVRTTVNGRDNGQPG